MKLLTSLLVVLCGSLATAKQCENLLPGVARMSRGVDITTLDLFPSDFSLTSGFRQSLFDFTCDQETKWTHPSIANFQFPVPDQVAAVNTIPGGALNDKLELHKTLNTYKKTLSVQVGLDVTTGAYGDYSLSTGFKRVQEQILNSNQTIADVSAYVSAVQMDFRPYFNMKPNENFVSFVTKVLPAKYEEGADKYAEFLDTFGTHYFESGVFGGYLLQQTSIEDSYAYQTTDKDISATLQAGYLAMVSGKVAVDQSTSVKKDNFNEFTRTSHYYYGGQTNLVGKFNAEQFAQWSASVPKDPWLFGGRLKPIENLITDETVKAQVKTAVYVKKTRAYLEELKQTLMLISKVVAQTQPEVTRISELMAQSVPKEADVHEVAQHVEQLLAEAQAVKDRAYLQRYAAQLNQLQHYELYCKKEMADRCDNEKKHDVDEALATASHLETQLTSLANQAALPDTEQVRALIAQASELLRVEQNTPVAECREKLFCNLCKDVVVDIIKKDPCNSAHIKELLRVHL